jgi:cytochrome c oxidase subunit 2
MRVDLYERAWMWIAAAMIAGFFGAIVVGAVSSAVHPPSHMETIDPLTVRTSSEFAQPGVSRRTDGSVLVLAIAEIYRFVPSTIEVPAGVPVTFRITSPDVIHGFQVVGTNANVTVAPGYVSELTVTFPSAGEHLVVCNEYCGLSHHLMHGRIVVYEEGSR